MKILALDLSLTSTGWARSDGTSGVIQPKGEYARGIDRLRWIRWSVKHLMTTALNVRSISNSPIELVVIEGYAFGRIEQAHHLGELGGVIRCMLADEEVPFVEIPPSSLKKFATGKGGCSKDEVLTAAVRKLAYPGSSKDEADAMWLRAMACAHYWGPGEMSDPLTKAQQEALQAITWPKITVSPPTEAHAHAR